MPNSNYFHHSSETKHVQTESYDLSYDVHNFGQSTTNDEFDS